MGIGLSPTPTAPYKCILGNGFPAHLLVFHLVSLGLAGVLDAARESAFTFFPWKGPKEGFLANSRDSPASCHPLQGAETAGKEFPSFLGSSLGVLAAT